MMLTTRKDLLDLIEMHENLNELAANASAFASASIDYASGVVDNIFSYYYEYTRLLYIMYHENTKLCLSVYSYDTDLLRRNYVKGVMY
jgi:hypothetical protein